MFKLVLKKAEEPEIKLPTSAGSSKKQEGPQKTSISALLTMSKPLTMWITINWKILKEMGIPDHLTCLLRNLYAGQEATVRTGHGTTDWFQIGKGVRQGCVQVFPSGTAVKNQPVMQEMWVLSLGQEDPLEMEIAIYSSILAWEIAWTEEPDRL